jgi:hypothetical protein
MDELTIIVPLFLINETHHDILAVLLDILVLVDGKEHGLDEGIGFTDVVGSEEVTFPTEVYDVGTVKEKVFKPRVFVVEEVNVEERIICTLCDFEAYIGIILIILVVLEYLFILSRLD